jgi:2,4-dienoyl-CoA reductase-like NADH-dependent reductase (Old Yellow Enzyme family)
MMSLLDPLDLGSIPLPNRFVMAPMTRARSNRDAIPNE